MADVGHLILLYFSVFTTSLSGEVIDSVYLFGQCSGQPEQTCSI